MNSISASSGIHRQARATKFRRLGGDREPQDRVQGIVNIPADELYKALTLTLILGGGILLSPTSDGGALSLILYDDEERYRAYVTSAEEFSSALEAVRDHMESKMAGHPPTPLKARSGASVSK
jgi:hypothetical protein